MLCFLFVVRGVELYSRCSCMGCGSVSSCRCCMFVSCVHPVAGLNDLYDPGVD